jgi:hypothetical protein
LNDRGWGADNWVLMDKDSQLPENNDDDVPETPSAAETPHDKGNGKDKDKGKKNNKDDSDEEDEMEED